MEAIGHMACPLNGNVQRQKTVGAAHPRTVCALDFGVKVDHLHEPVHPRIGAPRAHHIGGLHSHEGAQRTLQVVLHGTAAWLALPAFVACPVVADSERDAQSEATPMSGQLGEERGGLGFQRA